MIPLNYFLYVVALEYALCIGGMMKILARWGMLGEQDGARAYYLWHGQVALHYTWQRKNIWSVYPVITLYRQDKRISQLLLRAPPWFYVSCFSCKSISWWLVVVKEWVILPAPPWQLTSCSLNTPSQCYKDSNVLCCKFREHFPPNTSLRMTYSTNTSWTTHFLWLIFPSQSQSELSRNFNFIKITFHNHNYSRATRRCNFFF